MPKIIIYFILYQKMIKLDQLYHQKIEKIKFTTIECIIIKIYHF